MTPERFRQVDDLFQAAFDLAPEERTQFLDEACRDDPGLRREVDLLLLHDSGGATELAGAVERAAALVDFEAGRRLGPYVLVRELGQGGMGAVYEARRADDQFQQSVAIKLIRRDRVSDYMVTRFRVERQILASLQHPNIASLLDGGTTTDGRPYFVLEFIDGLPILKFCHQANLDIPGRLQLFQFVCAAVHYAHRKLVIHRDLKPANVLVTADGVPKLLDFGIAKLLEPGPGGERAEQTRTEMRMMTPEYASPEQIRGESLTTSTDIYSLGVLLYELLAGDKPYRVTGRTLHEIENEVCLHDPVPVSAAVADPKLRRQLEGDLENIVAKAMRKEPERRYSSAEALAEDIGRYLSGWPVQARPDTLGYRLGKLIRRNKWTAAVAALLLLSLAGGIATTTYQARRAERRFSQVRKLANTFLFDFDKEIQNLPGATKAREMLVATALEYLNTLYAEAGNDTELQWELADAFVRIGNIQGYPSQPNLGRSDDALASYGKAIAIAEGLLARGEPLGKRASTITAMYNRAGYVNMLAARHQRASAFFQKGLAMAERGYGKTPGVEAGLLALMNCHILLSDSMANRGQSRAALDHLKEALRLSEERAAKFPSLRSQYGIASVLGRIEWEELNLGDPESASKTIDRARKIREDLLAKSKTLPQDKRELAGVYGDLCLLYLPEWSFNEGDPAQAAHYCGKALELVQSNLRADAVDAQSKYDVSFRQMNYGMALLEAKPAAAIPVLESAVQLTGELVKAKFVPSFSASNHGRSLANLADALWQTGRKEQALQRSSEAVAFLETLQKSQPEERLSRNDLLWAYRVRTKVLLSAGDSQRALDVNRKAQQLAQETAARFDSAYTRRDVALTYEEGAAIQERLGNFQETRTNREKAFALWREWTKAFPDTPYVRAKLAGYHSSRNTKR